MRGMGITHLARDVAFERLDQLIRKLRVECPWDREQDERSIVPHTVEEAGEVAEAAEAGDDAALHEELGDLLFQVLFLAMLLEERGAGDLTSIADGLREKLIRRHPHVFGDVKAVTVEDAVDSWRAAKAEEKGTDER